MYDIHSHVLFGIDDGAKSIDDSVELCRMAEDDGVTAIVATPHIRDEVWPNRRNGIVERLEEVRQRLKNEGRSIEVVLGSEVYFTSGIVDAVREGEYPTYADRRRYVLFELPNFFLPQQVQQAVFDFRTAGITPVLAHPERNAQMMANMELLETLVRMGTVTQVTAMSITGRFGRSAKKAADLLLDSGLGHVVASDAHHAKFRPPVLREARARVSSRYGDAVAQRLFVDNPRRVIEGEEIDTWVPVAEQPKRGLRGLLSRLF